MKFIKNLKKIKKDTLLAGGKGVNLGEMLKIGIPVPPGFIVLASAFERFLEEADIDEKIKTIWDRINIENIESAKKNSKIIRVLILKKRIPKDIKKEILHAFKELKARYVAVRSSATAEDSKINSWAGGLETYLNTEKEGLLKNVKKCWASLYTPQVLFYRTKRGLKRKKISIAVVVQKMIQSEVSGVCFTVHPVTKNRNQIIIEVVQGLGKVFIQGKITPDRYVIEKDSLKILENISQKGRRKLSEKEIKELIKLCIKIENHFQVPQDIEWGREENKFYILQSRPITTL